MTAPVTRSEDVRLEPGTPIPWKIDDKGYIEAGTPGDGPAWGLATWYSVIPPQDARFIVYAVNSVQQLEADRARLVAMLTVTQMKFDAADLLTALTESLADDPQGVQDALDALAQQMDANSALLAEMEATDD